MFYKQNNSQTINEITTQSKITEENTKCMFEAITRHGMFHNAENNMGLYNFLENKETTPKQSHDILSLREMGQGYELTLNSQYLKRSSTDALVRKKKGSVHSPQVNVKNSVRKEQRRKEGCNRGFLSSKLHG